VGGPGAVVINTRYESAYVLEADLADLIFPFQETFLEPPVANPWPVPAAGAPLPR
jgi:hypothetical protein